MAHVWMDVRMSGSIRKKRFSKLGGPEKVVCMAI